MQLDSKAVKIRPVAIPGGELGASCLLISRSQSPCYRLQRSPHTRLQRWHARKLPCHPSPAAPAGTPDPPVKVGTVMTILGWGLTAYNATKPPANLMKARAVFA